MRYIPFLEERERRNSLSHRSSLIKARTAIRNQVHSILDKHDKACLYRKVFSVSGLLWLDGVASELHGMDGHMVRSHLRRLRRLEGEAGTVDALIAFKASMDEDVQLLMTLTGVSHFGTLLLISEIGDVHRFPSARHLISWVRYREWPLEVDLPQLVRRLGSEELLPLVFTGRAVYTMLRQDVFDDLSG